MATEWWRLLWPPVVAYLLGSIPFGLLVARWYGVPDIRKQGSGNIGATNVWRVIGAKAAIWVYALDIGKGALAVMIGRFAVQGVLGRPEFLSLCALVVVLGSLFSVFLGFRGGKGVNAALGATFALLPLQASISLAVFVIVVAIWRYISLGSLLGVFTLVATILIQRFTHPGQSPTAFLLYSVALFLTVLYSHRTNIKRLVAGTESKFGRGTSSYEGQSHG